MATPAGYAVGELTIGDAYTAIVHVWREVGSPVVAASGDGVVTGPDIEEVGAWVESRVTFLATAIEHIIGVIRVTQDSGRIHLGPVALVPVPSLEQPYEGPYFDGDNDSDALTYQSWTNRTPEAASISVELSPVVHQLRTAGTESSFGPAVAGLALRSPDGAQVTARVISTIDNTVLATELFKPTVDWERYYVSAPFGRAAYLRIDAVGSYDIDEVVLEPGTAQLPFFDGTKGPTRMDEYALTTGAAEYRVVWTDPALPDRSTSRMTWQGEATISRAGSDWRPFLQVDDGTLSAVQLHLEYTPLVPVEDLVAPYERTIFDVACVEGPLVITEHATSGGVVREVDFLLVAGAPHSYGASRTLLDERGLDTVTHAAWSDPVVPAQPVTVISDPNNPTIPEAPRPPVVPVISSPMPTSWRRHWIDIPADSVTAWSQTVPTIVIGSDDTAVRSIRVRFHPNPFDFPAQQVDPLNYCSEFILSYLPPNTTVTMDGTVSRADAVVGAGQPIPASQLLYGTGGVPMTWPELSCGISYVMTVDLPAGAPTDLSISLALTRRE